MHVVALATIALLAIAAPPAPTRHVEDLAVVLTPATRDAIDAKLVAYEQATGHQIVVWIGFSLEGAPLDDWAVKTFAAWKLGRAGLDDGLAVFIFRDDHQIAIEVGYGLEERVPDAIASRIIREVMAPRLQALDPDGAVVAGVDSILAAIEGKAWTAPPTATAMRKDERIVWLYIIFGGVALLLFIKHPRSAMWLVWSILTAGRGGGGGRGGFHGGGGRSGGGGARGGW